jgi:hypothetical protein
MRMNFDSNSNRLPLRGLTQEGETSSLFSWVGNSEEDFLPKLRVIGEGAGGWGEMKVESKIGKGFSTI